LWERACGNYAKDYDICFFHCGWFWGSCFSMTMKRQFFAHWKTWIFEVVGVAKKQK
jgi:hypothetical protein